MAGGAEKVISTLPRGQELSSVVALTLRGPGAVSKWVPGPVALRILDASIQ